MDGSVVGAVGLSLLLTGAIWKLVTGLGGGAASSLTPFTPTPGSTVHEAMVWGYTDAVRETSQQAMLAGWSIPLPLLLFFSMAAVVVFLSFSQQDRGSASDQPHEPLPEWQRELAARVAPIEQAGDRAGSLEERAHVLQQLQAVLSGYPVRSVIAQMKQRLPPSSDQLFGRVVTVSGIAEDLYGEVLLELPPLSATLDPLPKLWRVVGPVHRKTGRALLVRLTHTHQTPSAVVTRALVAGYRSRRPSSFYRVVSPSDQQQSVEEERDEEARDEEAINKEECELFFASSQAVPRLLRVLTGGAEDEDDLRVLVHELGTGALVPTEAFHRLANANALDATVLLRLFRHGFPVLSTTEYLLTTVFRATFERALNDASPQETFRRLLASLDVKALRLLVNFFFRGDFNSVHVLTKTGKRKQVAPLFRILQQQARRRLPSGEWEAISAREAGRRRLLRRALWKVGTDSPRRAQSLMRQQAKALDLLADLTAQVPADAPLVSTAFVDKLRPVVDAYAESMPEAQNLFRTFLMWRCTQFCGEPPEESQRVVHWFSPPVPEQVQREAERWIRWLHAAGEAGQVPRVFAIGGIAGLLNPGICSLSPNHQFLIQLLRDSTSSSKAIMPTAIANELSRFYTMLFRPIRSSQQLAHADRAEGGWFALVIRHLKQARPGPDWRLINQEKWEEESGDEGVRLELPLMVAGMIGWVLSLSQMQAWWSGLPMLPAWIGGSVLLIGVTMSVLRVRAAWRRAHAPPATGAKLSPDASAAVMTAGTSGGKAATLRLDVPSAPVPHFAVITTSAETALPGAAYTAVANGLGAGGAALRRALHVTTTTSSGAAPTQTAVPPIFFEVFEPPKALAEDAWEVLEDFTLTRSSA